MTNPPPPPPLLKNPNASFVKTMISGELELRDLKKEGTAFEPTPLRGQLRGRGLNSQESAGELWEAVESMGDVLRPGSQSHFSIGFPAVIVEHLHS